MRAGVIGHDVMLSETNAHGWVPLCSCGWIGAAVPSHSIEHPKTKRHVRQVELTKSIALDAHKLHCHEMAAEIARASERQLAAIGSDIKAANLTLQRRGRWGNG
jgi:hypothetical protein